MSVIAAISLSRAPGLAFLAVGLFWGSFAALAPRIKAQIGADDGLFGLLLLGTSIGLVSTMVLAPAFDNWQRNRAMPLAAAGLALAFLLPGWATTPTMFFAFMILTGLASGLCDVIMNARVSDLEAQHNRPLMNANHGVFSVGYTIGALYTGFMREIEAPSPVIFGLIAVIVLMTTPAMRVRVVRVEAKDQSAVRFPYAIVLLCGGIVLLAFMAEAAVESWSALHVERTLGGRAAEGALGPATLGFTMAIGRFTGQSLSERFTDSFVIFWASCLSIVGALLAATAINPPMAYLGFGTLGLGVSVIGPLGLAIVGRLVDPKIRTLAISRTAVIGFSGFFLAPAAMGMMSQEFGLRVAFAAIAVLVMGLFPLIWALRRRGA